MFPSFFRHLCFSGVVELLGKVKTSFFSFKSVSKLTFYLLKYVLIIYMAYLDHKIKCRTKQEKTLICTIHENGEESFTKLNFPDLLPFCCDFL